MDEFDEERAESSRRALVRVHAMALPQSISLNEEDLQGVSRRHDEDALHLFRRLTSEMGSDISGLVALANRLTWLSLWRGAEYINDNHRKFHEIAKQRGEIIRWNGHEYVPLTPKELRQGVESLPAVWTATTYASFDGFADSLHSELADVSETPQAEELRRACGFSDRILSEHLLEAASLYWHVLAARELKAGDQISGMEWLRESCRAREDAHTYSTWSWAEDYFRSEFASRTEPATKARIAQGEASRLRIIEVASEYRGRMALDRAAPIIGEKVGKSPSHVKRTLSAEFPGKKWSKPNDPV